MDQGTMVCFGMLIQALQLVAAEADTQVSSLPSFVHIPDEIALTFDHPYTFTDKFVKDGLITGDQKRALDGLNTLFDEMTQDKELWTLDQVRESPKWQETRILARNILRMLGQKLRRPDLSGIVYVPSDDGE